MRLVWLWHPDMCSVRSEGFATDTMYYIARWFCEVLKVSVWHTQITAIKGVNYFPLAMFDLSDNIWFVYMFCMFYVKTDRYRDSMNFAWKLETSFIRLICRNESQSNLLQWYVPDNSQMIWNAPPTSKYRLHCILDIVFLNDDESCYHELWLQCENVQFVFALVIHP